ncbi:hypothetical protein PLICRDRAFT_180682 [Plicaturopsis crispa FD-325 SS-3]|uniref:Uncharacterized protein n=1 Tax=Plicaturopsis crispa FD-325 SS-3 TaxID=944288 RepID=A0A0C9T4S1_PLICR|nr:hypothetical protein PLICRDRAFT_180682 [Plicaturopsis crispa FD-325 SS-3]
MRMHWHILEGIATVLGVGVVAPRVTDHDADAVYPQLTLCLHTVLVDYPETATFLTPEERAFVLHCKSLAVFAFGRLGTTRTACARAPFVLAWLAMALVGFAITSHLCTRSGGTSGTFLVPICLTRAYLPLPVPLLRYLRLSFLHGMGDWVDKAALPHLARPTLPQQLRNQSRPRRPARDRDVALAILQKRQRWLPAGAKWERERERRLHLCRAPAPLQRDQRPPPLAAGSLAELKVAARGSSNSMPALVQPAAVAT